MIAMIKNNYPIIEEEISGGGVFTTVKHPNKIISFIKSHLNVKKAVIGSTEKTVNFVKSVWDEPKYPLFSEWAYKNLDPKYDGLAKAADTVMNIADVWSMDTVEEIVGQRIPISTFIEQTKNFQTFYTTTILKNKVATDCSKKMLYLHKLYHAMMFLLKFSIGLDIMTCEKRKRC